MTKWPHPRAEVRSKGPCTRYSGLCVSDRARPGKRVPRCPEGHLFKVGHQECQTHVKAGRIICRPPRKPIISIINYGHTANSSVPIPHPRLTILEVTTVLR